VRSRKTLFAIGIGILLVFSFLYGVVTVQYKLFPFELLIAIKQPMRPSPSLSPSLSHGDYFYNKKSFFEQHGQRDYDVVFIGDSITDGAEWEDLFPSLKIANRGISCDRTDGVLERLDSIYSTNAKKAFIMIGINDFGSGVEVNVVFENYKNIVNNLVAHEMHPYVQSTILAGNQWPDNAILNPKIMALNALLKKMAADNNSVTYIDLNEGLASRSFLDSKYSRDGVHLNGCGYAVWKDIIKSYLQ
jgi:lysophospholipase L1-like esterase